MTAATIDSFVHPALFYGDTADYLAGTLPFIQGGLDADEPVMIAVPGANLDHIRSALGGDADRVQLHDMSVAGRNPGRIIPGVLLAFAAKHTGRAVRIVGEPIYAERTPAEYPACAQHEALINLAFAGRRASILCPYDTSSLDESWLADAYRTHPVVRSAAAEWPSPAYGDPAACAADFNHALPDPPADARQIGVDSTALSGMRRAVTEQAGDAGLPVERINDLIIAVSELAANTIEHGGAAGTLTLWTDGKILCCQLTDTGHITDPLAGRIPVPVTQATGGRGLVMVNQLVDLVRIHTRPGATTVRLHMYV
ncbi:anti-sigma regulatory factor (Ser/Thr protein kinase) [Allocatelliglobosispora scoriae]|uniref:Anti-sigma regulatory factor (Ser/Thr protein kinase) n=1 Tax=Allocatelliglobosispora scoriae TaxID=643052 RepID=A0A841BQ00_9ACTN|nr:sensor histidine kinase [Allocatelliglobosispora scoriae]MBB5868900.1 anti-sigma regulatory factor (Ser/Thr protein kinase) [Allocatelliglobosispora scoriae]